MDTFKVLDELEDWADLLAVKYRAEGHSAQMRGRQVIAATHIGREFAFQLVVSEIRSIRERLQGTPYDDKNPPQSIRAGS